MCLPRLQDAGDLKLNQLGIRGVQAERCPGMSRLVARIGEELAPALHDCRHVIVAPNQDGYVPDVVDAATELFHRDAHVLERPLDLLVEGGELASGVAGYA